ncbi:MAG: hypothetical protein ABL930_04625 [Pseudobdellovibrio sp.]
MIITIYKKMNTADNTTESKKSRYIAILVILALVAAILSSIPAVQVRIKPFFSSESRLVLAKINAFFGVEQTEYLILKIKDPFGIHIEIYESKNEKTIFKQKFELLQDTDAYITLDKNSTNLALSDVDKDGQLDILAPSVDHNGNLRLNTFRYNFELQQFEPLAQ